MHPFMLAKARADATRNAGELVGRAFAGLFRGWRRSTSLGERNSAFGPGDPS